MTTLQITPELIEAYHTEARPPMIKISPKNIAFNIPARKLLALEPGDRFLIECEDGNLFFKMSVSKGFVVHETGKYKVLSASAAGVGPYIAQLIRKQGSSFAFTIGTFEAGRRLLLLKSTINKK